MKIYFIRHGDPNYKDNCLTPLGHLQAEALAERLLASGKKFTALYTSKYGRAVETAEHTADKLGMPVTVLDFMHEISSGSHDMEKEEKLKFSPWLCGRELVEQGTALPSFNPEGFRYWEEGLFKESYERVVNGFDEWMKELGFVREGLCYRVTKKNSDRLLVFAHGGSISCLIAHFMGMNPFAITQYFHIHCTSITTVHFHGDEGELCIPKFETINDHVHMEDIVYTEPQE